MRTCPHINLISSDIPEIYRAREGCVKCRGTDACKWRRGADALAQPPANTDQPVTPRGRLKRATAESCRAYSIRRTCPVTPLHGRNVINNIFSEIKGTTL